MFTYVRRVKLGAADVKSPNGPKRARSRLRRKRELREAKQPEPINVEVPENRLQHAATLATKPNRLLESVRSESGEKLPDAINSTMRERLGQDFGAVRVHTGQRSGKLARALNADAFTVGRDIVFDEGKYSPFTQTGQRLLLHELAHVVQQQKLAQPRVQRRVSIGNGELYRFYVSQRDYGGIAVVLNGESPQVIREELNHFTPLELSMIHEKAKEWPGSESNIARMTASYSLQPEERQGPKPYSAAKSKLRDLYPQGSEQQAIDAAIQELGIDTGLLEDGTMKYDGSAPVGKHDAALTFQPHHPKRKGMNVRPFVEIYHAAFGQEWALLRSTVWHEYQHVLQYTSSSMLVSGTNTSNDAAEVEAYCREALESEGTDLDEDSVDFIAKNLGKKWGSLTKHWRGVSKSQKARLIELHDRALVAIKRMSTTAPKSKTVGF